MLNALLLALMLTAQPADADTLKSNLGGNGGLSVTSVATYVLARDANTATGSGGGISVGQSYASTYGVYRSFVGFPIPAGGMITSGKLIFDGSADSSTTDFVIDVVGASLYKSILATNDFPLFDGRTAGSAHTGTILNNAWNSSAYSADWNSIEFNSAGLDSLNAAMGDTLWIALISHEDYTNSEPSSREYVTFSSAAYQRMVITRMGTRHTPYSLSPTPLYDKSPVPLYRGY